MTEGQIFSVTGTFTDEAGNPQDPGTVAFEYAVAPPASAQGATTTLTYNGNSVPGPGIVARLSQGVFKAQGDTTGNPGTYTFEWVSTGSYQTVSDPPGVFMVNPKAL